MKRTASRQIARAFAEVLIILVGVLIALALDRWAAGLDDRALESRYLARLEVDLVQDSAALRGRIQDTSRRLEFALSVLDQVEGRANDRPEPGEFIERLETLAWFTAWSPARSTWDELMATGRVDLLRNRETRQHLLNYFTGLEGVAKGQADFEDQFARYEIPAWSLIPPRLRLRVFPGPSVAGLGRVGPAPTNAEVNQIARRLATDPTLYGAFVSLIQNLEASKRGYEAAARAIQDALAYVRGSAS